MFDRFNTVLSSGQRIVTLPFNYMPGTSELLVSLNGQSIRLGVDYIELAVNQIALKYPAIAGELLEARILKALV